MRELRSDRSMPLFVTLLVLAFLVMTFDVRTDGGGVLGSFRSFINTGLEPVERVGSGVVAPLSDFVDGLGDIAGLRRENESLRALLAQRESELATLDDQLERLATLERLLDLEFEDQDLARTAANVTGLNDSFDQSFRIDRGTDDGVLEAQPVVDENGYLVGRVLAAFPASAIVVPITGDVEGVTVSVGEQDGVLQAMIGADELEIPQMTLDVFEQAQPVTVGQRVVTSVFSGAFPPGIPVGEIVADASPQSQTLAARVQPFFDLRSLRVVSVLVWPRDAGAPSQDDGPQVGEPGAENPADGSTETSAPGATDTSGIESTGTDSTGVSDTTGVSGSTGESSGGSG